MKKTKKYFNRLLALTLSVLILVLSPTEAFAISRADLNNMEEYASHDMEDVISSSMGSYSYTAPTVGSFIIESVSGSVSIVNETPVIEFNDRIVTIPAFDYYKVVDQSGNLRFYQADVSKDTALTNKFAYIGLYGRYRSQTVQHSCIYYRRTVSPLYREFD